MRGDLEGYADILAFDGGKGVVRPRGAGGEGASLKRYVLPDQDFRLLVIQGQQARRGQQVALAVGRQRGDQHAEVVGAQADNGAVRQIAQGVVGGAGALILDRLQHPADGQARATETGATEAAAVAAGIHRPLHAQGIADIAGDFDDGGFHHHLGARHIELAHDIFQGRHHIRFGQQHQGVEAFVGADQDILRFAAAFAAGFRLELLGQLTEGFGQALGVAMA